MFKAVSSKRQLIRVVEELKMGEIGKIVSFRINQFRRMNKASTEKWFSELCFCILTANSTAEMGIRIQNLVGERGFIEYSSRRLSEIFRSLGYRFPKSRAQYIVESRRYLNIKEIIFSHRSEFESRRWLAENVRGIGYKEASHFLRNVGYLNLAILDRHILKLLGNIRLIPRVRRMNSKVYESIEEKLRPIGEELDMPLGELDLYLWYLMTGKILK